VAPHLFKAVGGKAPAVVRVRGVNVTYIDPKTGTRVTGARDGILVRYIEGTKSMGALTEPEIYAMKEDLAMMRVFRLWLADTDPHMGNFLVAANGEIFPIDFGFANLTRRLSFRQLPKDTFNSQKEMLENALAFRNLVDKHYPKDPSAVLYRWIDRIDGMLNYDDMEKTVEGIKSLCTQNNGKGLRDILERNLPPEEVQEMLDVLVERAHLLEGVLKTRFTQFKRVSFLYPWKSDSQFAQSDSWAQPLALAA